MLTIYSPPGSPSSVVSVAARYDNFIGGEWVAPVKGQYFQNSTPVTGQVFTEIARSTSDDVELALDAAHGAKAAWGKAWAADRALVLNRVADRLQEDRGPGAVAGARGRSATCGRAATVAGGAVGEVRRDHCAGACPAV